MSEVKKPFVHEARANNWTLGEALKPKRQRKPPRVDNAIAAAKKAGLGVAGATLAPDGALFRSRRARVERSDCTARRKRCGVRSHP
jgi:hypothetical protein